MRDQTRQVDRSVLGKWRGESDGETELVGAERHSDFLVFHFGLAGKHSPCPAQGKKKAGHLAPRFPVSLAAADFSRRDISPADPAPDAG